MSFTVFKNKSVSQKTILVEIDLGQLGVRWTNHRPGVWEWQYVTEKTSIAHSYLRGSYLFGSYLRGGISAVGEADRFNDINSVSVDGVSYIKQTSRVNCVDTNKSFFYDLNTTKLYVHFDNFDEPFLHTIIVGILSGVSNRSIIINNTRYEPLLQSIPTISKSKDSLYFGLVSFDGGSLTFNNTDGFFDSYVNKFIFGQPVVIRYGGDDLAYSDYRVVFKGYIDKLDLNYEQCIINAVDNRKQLSRKIPNTYYDQTTFPNIKDANVGKPIPLVWGAVDNIPIVCTNEDKGTTGNFTFTIAEVTDHTTGITNIVQIYVDGVATTWANASLPNATFELTTGLYTKGKKVTGDVQGFKLGSTMDDNSLDVIEDMLNTYQSIAFTSDNFNTTEWTANKSSQYDIGLFLNQETELIDVIENIAESNFATFLILDDGRYTWRRFIADTTASRTIDKEEFLSSPDLNYDGNEFFTSVNVKYKKDWGSNDFASYNNTLSEADIFARYLKYQSRNVETVITSNTDAFKLSQLLIDYMDTVPANINIETGTQNIDLEIGDIVKFNIDRVDSVWLGDVQCEIVGVDKNIGLSEELDTVVLKGRSMETVTKSPFAIGVEDFAINVTDIAFRFGL